MSLVLLLGGAGTATLAPTILGQDPKPGSAERSAPTPDGETLQRAQELSRTTVEHDRLAKLAGKWKLTLRTPLVGGKVRQEKGTVVGQPILGGRYVVLNFRMSLSGRDVEAVQIVGFDTLRHLYTSSWRDNQTTWPIQSSGSPGKEADLLHLAGSLRDAETPRGQALRMTLDMRTKDQVTVRLHTGVRDKEVLMQEQVWRR